MKDVYISKYDAVKTVEKECKAFCPTKLCKLTEYIENAIEEAPEADVQPVIHAHWRRGEEKGFRTYNPLWYCSNCGGQIRYDTRMRQYQKAKRPVWEVNAFCRKCGAKMDGDTQ